MKTHSISTSTVLSLLAGAILGLTPAPARATLYSVDDGTAEASVGGAATQTIANEFTAVAGGQTIQSIEIAWGAVANGLPFTARLWSDPNGDGNPSDAVQLSSLAGTVSLAGTSTFVLYDIPDVTLSVGDNFFVGFTITPASGFPAAVDTTPPISVQGWATLGADFPGSGLLNIGTTFDSDLMIRANGVAAGVPEPGTLLTGVLSLGVVLALCLRRHPRTAAPA